MPGTAAGTQAFNSRTVFSATSSTEACFAHFLPETAMFGLQHHAFEFDALDAQFLERLVQHALGHIMAAVDVVIAVHQHFRLHDRHDLRRLAQRRIARQRMRVDADRGHGRDAAADIYHRAPFGEARAALVIFLQSLGELVETDRDHLAGAAGQGLRAFVDLDAGN